MIHGQSPVNDRMPVTIHVVTAVAPGEVIDVLDPVAINTVPARIRIAELTDGYKGIAVVAEIEVEPDTDRAAAVNNTNTACVDGIRR